MLDMTIACGATIEDLMIASEADMKELPIEVSFLPEGAVYQGNDLWKGVSGQLYILRE